MRFHIRNNCIILWIVLNVNVRMASGESHCCLFSLVSSSLISSWASCSAWSCSRRHRQTLPTPLARWCAAWRRQLFRQHARLFLALGEDVLANQRHLTIRVADGHRGRTSKAYDVYQNVLQIVVWESIFFNQGVACVEFTRLWAVLVNGWLLRAYDFCSFQALPTRRFGVAVTVQSRRRYGVIAMPLRCNRDAIAP